MYGLLWHFIDEKHFVIILRQKIVVDLDTSWGLRCKTIQPWNCYFHEEVCIEYFQTHCTRMDPIPR